MKPFIWTVLTLVIVCLGLTACSSGPSGQCYNGLCVELKIEEPARLNESIPVTLTITSDRDASDLEISLSGTGHIVIDPKLSWNTNKTAIQAHQPLVIHATALLSAGEDGRSDGWRIVSHVMSYQIPSTATAMI